MKTKIDFKTKLNAVEALVTLLKEWDKSKSVVLFISPTLCFKATRVKNNNAVLISFGRPNILERKFYKKAVKLGKGKVPRFLITSLK